jgi:tyrosyl-tRNA synthetase
MKIAELLTTGCYIKTLFADIHGYLDNMKAPLKLEVLWISHQVVTESCGS